jgi:hypothetical protein
MFTEAETNLFTLRQFQEIPVGLTNELLVDLHDLVQKFGVIDQVDKVRRIYLDEPHGIYICAPNDPSKKSMVIIGKDRRATEGSYLIRYLGAIPEILFWDRRVTVESIMSFIVAIDIIAKENELIDPVTGKRTQTNMYSEGGKWEVDDALRESRSVMLVNPHGPSAAQIIERFDHPELLTIMRTMLGGEVIVRKESLDYHQKREQVVLQVLKEEGISLDVKSLISLPFKKVSEIYDKVKQRMTQ